MKVERRHVLLREGEVLQDFLRLRREGFVTQESTAGVGAFISHDKKHVKPYLTKIDHAPTAGVALVWEEQDGKEWPQ